MSTAAFEIEALLKTASDTSGEFPNRDADRNFYRPEMPLRAQYYPLGFPLCIATNSADVLAAAQASWGRWQPRFDMEPIRLQVGVHEGGSECPEKMTVRAHEHLLTGTGDAENFYVMDLLQDMSFAWVTEAVVAQPLYLRYHFLESTALNHIASHHAAPVHAACVAHDGHGVLLCGDSGAGKSTLAFACARAGLAYVSDDASYLVHGREDRQVLGLCHSVRLRPQAAELFSEVRGRPLTPRMQGKPSIEIPMAELPAFRVTPECQVERVVFLNRNWDGEPELAPYSRDAARRYMQYHLHGWEPLRNEQVRSVERILSAPVYELRYRDLDGAIARLERLLREGR